VVVAVGLTAVEPLAAVEVKVPGAIAMLVAPFTDQLRVLLEPELMVAALAVKEVIVGADPVPVVEPDGIVDPQPMQASGIQASAQRSMARRTMPS
jgi:hypothetical protein